MSGTTQSNLDAEITQLQQDVAAANSAEDSAITLINGISGMIAAARADALAAGATDQELASLTAIDDQIKAKASALSSAVAANTQASPAPTTDPNSPSPSPAPAQDPNAPTPGAS